MWAQSEPEIAVNTSLYIARMANPWTLATKPTRITTPTKSWEIQGYKVNEGPAVLIRNGRVFLTFSASATDARYCMGLLTADADSDLLDRDSWVKTPDPIFVTNEETKRFGPGHNSFTVAEDGVTDVLVYHARDYRDITGDPLYDPNRHTRVQRLYWHPDGTPLFGVPVGDGGPIVRISPAGPAAGLHPPHRRRADRGGARAARSRRHPVPLRGAGRRHRADPFGRPPGAVCCTVDGDTVTAGRNGDRRSAGSSPATASSSRRRTGATCAFSVTRSRSAPTARRSGSADVRTETRTARLRCSRAVLCRVLLLGGCGTGAGRAEVGRAEVGRDRVGHLDAAVGAAERPGPRPGRRRRGRRRVKTSLDFSMFSGSPSQSTTTIWPGRSSLKRICSDRVSSRSRWIVRRSGRAPSTGSKPFFARYFLALSVSSRPMSLFLSWPSIRAVKMSTICRISSWRSWWKTIVSSMRLRNSGRKCCFSSSLTLTFIRS